MIRAAVIGWPVAHSRSPLIHGYWLERYGIEGSYERHAVEPGGAPAFIASLEERGLAGCNVTLPHKEAAFAAVRSADEATRRLGVVNTVYRRDGVTWGTSTDGPGFLASVAEHAPGFTPRGAHVVMLGAGGAARAIAGTLIDAGAAAITVVNRSAERAEALRAAFGPRIRPGTAGAMAEADLLVNTTSLGMEGQPPLIIDLERLPAAAVVTDIVYTPLSTPLVLAACARGHTVVPGLGMLLHQAVRGFSLWFGVTPEVTADLYEVAAAGIPKTGSQG